MTGNVYPTGQSLPGGTGLRPAALVNEAPPLEFVRVAALSYQLGTLSARPGILGNARFAQRGNSSVLARPP
ncbi:hypothetical protein [Streptomyces sp. NPDC057580]|uniref:hypothetical protein n=1 Tax=Streptomyces sp. NPDC057580 TaxID=3346173 RepID=UPI0036A74784